MRVRPAADANGSRLFLARAFAPVLSAKDDSVIIDIHSAMSRYAVGGIYSATKGRPLVGDQLAAPGTRPERVHVVGIHVGYVDTAMAANATDPKMDPADLVRTALDALEAGEYEVLANETSVQLKAGLSAPSRPSTPSWPPRPPRTRLAPWS
ncbi:NAD(P)-dependent dehydrogenase (short-subunit alcohol dehydrogenase family) [Arthrobacter pascens]|uniref:hypothetical protein n=1 Tax=Arthrobacter pascens TaxID=1677 RepID=UPI0028655D4E|nr:hypothetical protein [Arthrobacter pascens]MDR6558461.1 NAD(P)-dependent dehydrogenase (short-subunit alcohol dehydrogenase family) [Arthrobacter pascens]